MSRSPFPKALFASVLAHACAAAFLGGSWASQGPARTAPGERPPFEALLFLEPPAADPLPAESPRAPAAPPALAKAAKPAGRSAAKEPAFLPKDLPAAPESAARESVAEGAEIADPGEESPMASPAAASALGGEGNSFQAPGELPAGSAEGERPDDIGLRFYAEAWRQKVERAGSMNYPAPGGVRLEGSLRLEAVLAPDGTLISASILGGSGDPRLDEKALEIVRMAAPYARFPESLARRFGRIEIRRTVVFRAGP